jgi:hypothetical protein
MSESAIRDMLRALPYSESESEFGAPVKLANLLGTTWPETEWNRVLNTIPFSKNEQGDMISKQELIDYAIEYKLLKGDCPSPFKKQKDSERDSLTKFVKPSTKYRQQIDRN